MKMVKINKNNKSIATGPLCVYTEFEALVLRVEPHGISNLLTTALCHCACARHRIHIVTQKNGVGMKR